MLFGTINSPDAKDLSDSIESMATQIPPTDYGAAVVKMFLSLIVLVSLLFLSLWFIRRLIQHRLKQGNENQSIQILEKRVLSPKTILYLIEVDGKKTLISESQFEVRRIEGFTPLLEEPPLSQ